MLGNSRHRENDEVTSLSTDSGGGWSLSRRGLFGAGALLGLVATTRPTESALAWSSWTNATSPFLKKIGMGDCVHEDIVQIAYARVVRKYNGKGKTEYPSLLNPWAAELLGDRGHAKLFDGSEDLVDAGDGKTFANADDLTARLYRENLAYLRIGSFWNDAAANQLKDFAYSCSYANSVPKFSGDSYEGAWDVGQHIWETNEKNKTYWIKGLDALVQFMRDFEKANG